MLQKSRLNREITKSVNTWHNILYLVQWLSIDICLRNRSDALFSLFTGKTVFLSHLSLPLCHCMTSLPIPGGIPWLPFFCDTSTVRNVLWEITDEWYWKKMHACNLIYTAHPETDANRWLHCSLLWLSHRKGTLGSTLYMQVRCFHMVPHGLQCCESSITIKYTLYIHYLIVN